MYSTAIFRFSLLFLWRGRELKEHRFNRWFNVYIIMGNIVTGASERENLCHFFRLLPSNYSLGQTSTGFLTASNVSAKATDERH